MTAAKSKRPKKRRLRLRSEAEDIELLDLWSDGFATGAERPALTRGFVDIFDGADHIRHGLAYLAGEQAGRRTYVFKSAQHPGPVPAADYARLGKVED